MQEGSLIQSIAYEMRNIDRSLSAIVPGEFFDEGALAYVVLHGPVVPVVVAQLKYELGECVPMAVGGPETGLSNGANADLGLDAPHHGLLPPAHHVLDVALNVLVHPADVLQSVNVLEVGPQQSVEVVRVLLFQGFRNALEWN